jgi:hypothetical protein
MRDWMLSQLFALLVPVLIAPLVLWATNASKRVSWWLDSQHASVKQALALAYAALFNALAGAVGSTVCVDTSAYCDLTGLDWRVILTWALATAFHAYRPRRK